eukprot:EG_transcript_31370
MIAGADFGQQFGQRVRLTTRITEITEGYDVHTVCKELLQNADDAGATEMRFVLDHSTHGTAWCLPPRGALLQGPALYAYNDAVFTEQDFEALCDLGGAAKRADASKTGNFGQGFNAVYHLTDVPQIRSGACVAMLDPNRIFVAPFGEPGRRYNTSDPRLAEVSDSFAPLRLFSNSLADPYAGTLMRFPLRSTEMAAH